MEYAVGFAAGFAASWLWRRLSKRPTPWASRRTVKIRDIAEDDSRHSNSGDEWRTVPRLQLADVSSLCDGGYYSTGRSSYHCGD